MLQSVTSSQSPMPTPYVGNGMVTSSGSHWNKVDSTNMLQNSTLLEWSQPPLSVNNDSGEHHVNGSKINVISNEVVYPPNYTNMYPSNVINGYTTLHPTGGMNTNLISGQNRNMLGGYVWSNQSAPARFVSQPPAYRPPGNKTAVKKQKRIRTAFTTQQMMDLEHEYAKARYLDRARRIELSEILHLNERIIKIWFQNRRMKDKKDKAEAMYDSEEGNTSESSPERSNIPMLNHDQYLAFQTDVNYQDHIYMEQYLDMLATRCPSAASTSFPTSKPAPNFATSMPAAHFTSTPSISLSTTMPAAHFTSTPSISLSTTMLATSTPTAMLATSTPTTMPATNSPTSMPATSTPTTMPATSSHTSMPAISLPTLMPAYNSPNSTLETSSPSSMSATSSPSSTPPTTFQFPSTEVSELQATESPEITPQEVSASASPNDFFKMSWDLSYVRSLGFDF